MTELRVDTGVKTFGINGAVEVCFNDTDTDFCERLFNVFESVGQKQDEYETRAKSIDDAHEMFKFMRECDTKMRDEIDGLFGVAVCDAVFGRINVFAMSDGLPIWCNLLLTVMEQFDTAFAREQKATNPRIAKYTAKWQRKQGK